MLTPIALRNCSTFQWSSVPINPSLPTVFKGRNVPYLAIQREFPNRQASMTALTLLLTQSD